MGCAPSSSSVLMLGLGATRKTRANTAVLRQALQGIDVKGKEQMLDIHCAKIISVVDAQCIVDFLQRHADAVHVMSLGFRQLSGQAMEIFRDFFATTSLDKIVVIGSLGNENGGHLLSGLHGNRSVSKLALSDIGFEGAQGGWHLSELLQNNSHLKELVCLRLVSLGPEGARSLQSFLCINQTLQNLSLHTCGLGDEGTLVIVNALEENQALVKLCLGNNHITSNGLPLITRLLRRKKSLTSINLCSNAGLFDDKENTKQFAIALILQKSKLQNMNMSQCHISSRALIAIFQASINTLTQFYVYDNVRLEGKDLERLLKIIPRMTKLYRLHINLDFMNNESVLSHFHGNVHIRYLHGEASEEVEITNGPVFCILERNRWIYKTNKLRKHELQWNKKKDIRRRRPPLFGDGLWIKSMERITRSDGNNNNTVGASAIYQILQEKLVVWAKQQQTCCHNTAGTVGGIKKDDANCLHCDI